MSYPDDAELWNIIELSRDENGRVSYDDMEAWALSMGRHNCEDMGMLEAMMDSANDDFDDGGRE